MLRNLACAIGLMVLAAPAAAQIAAEPAPSANEDCRLPPPGEDGAAGRAAPDGESLSEMLDPCAGVLRPPPVGDADMVAPPPATGETPVIRPEDLPTQPPADG